MAAFDTEFTSNAQQAPDGRSRPRSSRWRRPALRGASRAAAERPDFQCSRSTRHAACRDRQPGVCQPLSSRASNRSGSGLPRQSEIGPPWATMVGVVADYRNDGATRAIRPEIYMPVRQQTAWNQLFMLVRGDGAPAALLPAVRQAIRALDPEQPIYAIADAGGSDRAVRRSSSASPRCCCRSSLGSRSCMAAVGIFGVMSYSVSARTQEMGVRLAVGAQRRDVVWLVIGHVLKLAGSAWRSASPCCSLAGRRSPGSCSASRQPTPHDRRGHRGTRPRRGDSRVGASVPRQPDRSHRGAAVRVDRSLRFSGSRFAGSGCENVRTCEPENRAEPENP